MKSSPFWPPTTTLALILVGLLLSIVSFIAVMSTPDLLWHPARDAELVSTYQAFQETGTLLIKESGSGSNYTQAIAPGHYSSAAWDDDPGVYVLASILGKITQSASPYPGLRVAEGLLVALPLLWLPLAVARVFRRARAGYSLLLLPLVLWLVNNGTILLGTEYGLSDTISTLRVYALYGLGASLTFMSLSLLLLASTFKFRLNGLIFLTIGFAFLAGLGNLTRSLSGVGIALAVGLIWWLNTTWRPKLLVAIGASVAAMALAMGLVSGAMSYLNNERAATTGQNLSELPNSHGTWHPLFLGLSFPEPITGQPSALGIPWSDEFGWEIARSVNPDVVIAGEEYDLIIRDAFWNAVSAQPVEAAWTYFAKFLYVIKHFGAMLLLILLGLVLGLLRPGKHRKALAVGSLIAVPTFIVGLIPAVLVMPLLYYFSDLSAALGLLLAISIGSLTWYLTSLPGFIRTSERKRISARITLLEQRESQEPALSVIIPCRNGEDVIQETITTLSKMMTHNDEIIVVENGSTDHTFERLTRLKLSWTSSANLLILQSEPGMGNALRTGVIASNNQRLLLTADDLPFGTTDIAAFTKLATQPLVAIGSKAHPDSKVNRTGSREFQSKIFRWLRSALLQSRVGDSQGTIWVDGPWARTFAILSHETGLMWTTELVMAAEQQGYTVVEVPVELEASHAQVQSRFGLQDATKAIGSFLKLAMYKDEYSKETWETAANHKS